MPLQGPTPMTTLSPMLPTPSIRIVTLAAAAIVALVVFVGGASAQSTDAARAPVAESEARELLRIEAAVDRGLEYLATKQDANGSWQHGMAQQPNTGINALCLLAFMGRGHVPGRGPYKETVGRALDAMIAAQQPDGLVVRNGGNSHGPMYEHGLATLALIEASGWRTDDAMRDTCRRAVAVIVGAQNNEGGWRYQPRPADVSIPELDNRCRGAA